MNHPIETDTYTARKNGKPCRIRVRRVGQNFGFCGELVARNGRVIDSTDTRPFAGAAHTAALALTRDGLTRAAESPTLREWWETSTSRSDMMWLIGRAHSHGVLTRRRLVHVAVRCCETVAHLMPPDALPLLADLSAWSHGAEDVDIAGVRSGLSVVRRADADAADAAAYAADAAAYAYAAYAADAAMCDVIRDAITIDEVCAALGLDPDQGVL